jgi:hypothetical protein
LSLNNWTFIPGVAYTKILPQANIELSGIWDMEFYTENPDTHFQNGILPDLEVLAIKRFKNGFGIGFVESWIQPGHGRWRTNRCGTQRFCRAGFRYWYNRPFTECGHERRFDC